MHLNAAANLPAQPVIADQLFKTAGAAAAAVLIRVEIQDGMSDLADQGVFSVQNMSAVDKAARQTPRGKHHQYALVLQLFLLQQRMRRHFSDVFHPDGRLRRKIRSKRVRYGNIDAPIRRKRAVFQPVCFIIDNAGG